MRLVRGMELAIQAGQLEVLSWMISISKEDKSHYSMLYVAERGQLHILKWAHENGIGKFSGAMYGAASQGHLHILEWLHQNGIEGNTGWEMDSAIQGGHLDVVKWLLANTTHRLTARCLDNAIVCNHMHI